jgi:hypothetical protein
MASSSGAAASGGIGIGGMLTVLFVGLKLTGNIDWPWWWVLSPVWIPIILLLLIVGIVLVIAQAVDK